MSTIQATKAIFPLVLALDVGTSSARAVLYDAQGRAVEGAESRTTYQMDTTPDGGVEIDADKLFAITARTLDALLQRASTLVDKLDEVVGGVGMCTFWHSLMGVDEAGRAATPIYNWNDTRSTGDAEELARELGDEFVHQRTGARPHASYYPAKLRWLRRTDPARYAKVAQWMSFGEYFYLRLFGRAVCGISMASGTGLLNPNACDWDAEMLAALGLTPQQLAPLAGEVNANDEMFVGLRDEFAKRWPQLKDKPWLPAIGDGASSNIGSGCVTPDSVALNVGTSGAMRVCWQAESVHIQPGLWCYRANRRYFVMGGALSNGGDVYAWCKRTLRVGDDDERIEEALAAEKPAAHGLTVLPFFSGERSTGWHGHARAAFAGLNLSTEPIDLLRAALEATAYRFAAIHARLVAEVPGSERIIASGGGILNSQVWTQMMADVIGVPVAASAVPEASSRGAALLVLQALGHLTDLTAAPAPISVVYEPDLKCHEIYQQARARQERLYDLLVASNPV